MTHGFVTVLIPFERSLAPAANGVLDGLGNMASRDIGAALDDSGAIHFMSMTVVCEADDPEAHLVLEASVDGHAAAALADIAGRLRKWLEPLLEAMGKDRPADLAKYLAEYRHDLGVGWRQTIGLAFSGTPEMSVKRINAEEAVAKEAQDWLEKNDRPELSARQRLERVRDEVFADPCRKWALVAQRIPASEPEPIGFWPLLGSFMRVLWPLAFVPVLCVLVLAWWAADYASGAGTFPRMGLTMAGGAVAGGLLLGLALREALGSFRAALWGVLVGAFFGLVIGSLSHYFRLIIWGSVAGVAVAAFAGNRVFKTSLGTLVSALAGLLAGAILSTIFSPVPGAPLGASWGAAVTALAVAALALMWSRTVEAFALGAIAGSVAGAIGGAIIGAAAVAHPDTWMWAPGMAVGCGLVAALWILCEGASGKRESIAKVAACAGYGFVAGALIVAITHALDTGTGIGAGAMFGAAAGLSVAAILLQRFESMVGPSAGVFVGAGAGVFIQATAAVTALVVVYALLLAGGIVGAWLGALLFASELLVAVIGLALCYVTIRVSEQVDAPQDEEPDADRLAAITVLENQTAQNHLAGVSVMKAGPVRRLALRLALWFIGEFGRYQSPPGYLSDIGTIHFARWILLPGNSKLLFLSNYDGSWTSYLEDFIARAHRGLTAIWSNTRDFPKTTGLIDGGASDGERFKRWARRQQRPTRFWYSAYPFLTTARIRANARICHGLVAAGTEEEAQRWLSLFQYKAPATVESREIPTLVFGGLKPLNHSACHVIELTGSQADHGAWLRSIREYIQYGEDKPGTAAWVAGFTQSGLQKLGLRDALPTFPAAFRQGMAEDGRAVALGDVGADCPRTWLWGGPDNPADAIIFLYADSPDHLATQEKLCRNALAGCGQVIYRLLTNPLPRKDGLPIKEPFGFTDGISQPIMRGSRKWVTQRNPMHVVEPGEMVLGYPDNLGYVAPLPRHGGRDVGKNGSFLVVRQLEQNPKAFNDFLDEKARELAGNPRVPGGDVPLREWVAAKMVGRWKDGTSLVRHPARPGIASGAAKYPDNDFRFGAEDPDGLCCPFGAHIRRANPRESFDPGSAMQVGITNRHRIFRVGRSYGPQGADAERLDNPGLLFMCVNSDIEGQFEFLQQTWILGSSFHGLRDEIDPAVGYRGRNGGESFTIPTEKGPLRLRGLKDFVRTRGGAYLFMPARRTIDYLCDNAVRGVPAAAASAY